MKNWRYFNFNFTSRINYRNSKEKKLLKYFETLKIIIENFIQVFWSFDGVNLDSSVMIRFIQKEQNGELFYKSGGGITCDSNVNLEYQELLDKIYLPF